MLHVTIVGFPMVGGLAHRPSYPGMDSPPQNNKIYVPCPAKRHTCPASPFPVCGRYRGKNENNKNDKTDKYNITIQFASYLLKFVLKTSKKNPKFPKNSKKFQNSPKNSKFSQFFHWLGVYNIKHNLARSCFQFWLSKSTKFREKNCLG